MKNNLTHLFAAENRYNNKTGLNERANMLLPTLDNLYIAAKKRHDETMLTDIMKKQAIEEAMRSAATLRSPDINKVGAVFDVVCHKGLYAPIQTVLRRGVPPGTIISLALVYTTPIIEEGQKVETSVTQCISIINTDSYLVSNDVITPGTTSYTGYMPKGCNTKGFSDLYDETDAENQTRPGLVSLSTRAQKSMETKQMGSVVADGDVTAGAGAGAGGTDDLAAVDGGVGAGAGAGAATRKARLAKNQARHKKKAEARNAAEMKVADAEAAIADAINLLSLHNYKQGRFDSTCKTCKFSKNKCTATKVIAVAKAVTGASADMLTPEAKAAVVEAINSIGHHKYKGGIFTKTCQECKKLDKEACTDAQKNAVREAVTAAAADVKNVSDANFLMRLVPTSKMSR